jgi:hypothetical protein
MMMAFFVNLHLRFFRNPRFTLFAVTLAHDTAHAMAAGFFIILLAL